MARKPKTKTEENLEAVTVQHEIPAQDAGMEGQELDNRSRCGGVLRTHREQQGLSVQTVASRLRLSPKQIDALEADNFDALPEATIARGFIRNYAKLLGINVEPLLDAYNVLVPSKAPHSFTIAPAPYATAAGKQYRAPNLKRWWPLLLVALLGVGAWLFYQSYIQKPNPVAPTANSLPAPEALPPIALPAGERQPEATTPQATTTELVLPPGTAPEPTAAATTPVTTEATPAQPAAPEVAPVPPVPATSEPVASSASISKLSRLEFSATQETWVSVTDASGKEIYNKILFAGNREMVEAAPPLSVVVGNANGTSLSVNGVETNLGPHTKVNVARIKVE